MTDTTATELEQTEACEECEALSDVFTTCLTTILHALAEAKAYKAIDIVLDAIEEHIEWTPAEEAA